MSKKEKDQTITIDDKEYKVADLTQEQVALVNHVSDLDRKINSAQFNIDQLNVGRSAFMNMLTEALKAEDAEVEVEEKVAQQTLGGVSPPTNYKDKESEWQIQDYMD